MSDPLDYDEATLSPEDGEGEALTLSREPASAALGIDPPGLLSAHVGLAQHQVFNGNFRKGPPDPSLAIDVRTSTSGSNFIPGWALTHSSNSNITVTQARDTASPSGSNIRFTFASGAAGDESFVEQLVDIGGSREGGFPDVVSAFSVAGGSNTGTFRAWIAAQYLTVDGSIVGMPGEQTDTEDIAAGGTGILLVRATTLGIAPSAARYIRLRVGVRRGAAATTATGYIDFTDVRARATVSRQEFTTAGSHTWYKPADATMVRVVCVGAGGGGGSGRRGAAGTARYGGGGGGGGAMSEATFLAADLASTVTVTIGTGGPGGTNPGLNDTDGNDGTNGGNTSFGSHVAAYGGYSGFRGTATTGPGGPVRDSGMQFGNEAGDSAVATAGEAGRANTGTVGLSEQYGGAGGGGGGGGISTGNVARNGGAGGLPVQMLTLVTAPAGGVVTTSPPGAGTTYGGFGGSGGGGGAPDASSASNRSGAAGARGGGGGGGAAAVNGSNVGIGGAGGDGYCLVVAW